MKTLLALNRLGLAALVVAGLATFVSVTGSESTTKIHYDTDGGVAAPPLPVGVPPAGFDPSASLANVDGSVLVTPGPSRVRFVSGQTGETLASSPMAPNAELRAVSADGSLAALFAHDSHATTITVISASAASRPRSYRFDGLVEPEAFATDGSLLYIIDHEISEVAGAYRVRPLDLATGELGVMLGPQKIPIAEEMNGAGRRQVWAPAGDRLYTLYIRQTVHVHDDGNDHVHGTSGTDGFVHILDLEDEWAFCLHLPDGFGTGELDRTAIALDPNGRQLAILDLNAGQLAWASTDDLVVTETVDLPRELSVDGQVHLSVTSRHIAIGWGAEVRWFDRTTLVEHPSVTSVGSNVIGMTSFGDQVFAWTDSDQPLTLGVPD